MMTEETTLSEKMKEARELGYTIDLNEEIKEMLEQKRSDLSPTDLLIEKVYRFEGLTNPSDEAALYLIKDLKNNRKGLLVDGYGTYADDVMADFIRKIPEAK